MAGKPQRGSLRKIYLVNTKSRAALQAFADLLGDLPDNIFPLHPSPLDLPIAVSRFADVKAKSVRVKPTSLRALAKEITATHGASKRSLPLLKLARFGNSRTDSASLRHDANLLSVTGIEGDYDAGQVSPEDAADRLRKAGLAALIYTTPSHSPAAPRWRVLAPLAAEVSPAERDDLCARLNGALGGVLAAESFTRSQTYYMGQVAGAAPVQTILVDGQPIDKLLRIRGVWPPHSTRKPKRETMASLLGEIPADGDAEPFTDADLLGDADWSRIRSALAAIEDASERQTWLEIGQALHAASDGAERGFNLWCEWSQRCPEKFDERDQRRTWRSFKRGGIGIATLFMHAHNAGWQESADETVARPSRLTFLSPAECDAAPSRSYLVKGLLAERDVACIFGAPGAGKSLLAPALAYAVAQGRDTFSMRTRQGGVFYVAAEDPHGMRGRIKAVRAAHGEAPAFQLVEGVSDLLAKDSPDLAALMEAVESRKPRLIVIDTLAMAFPGLEENSAEAMGRVVSVARKLTEHGAAVVMIHHDTKAEGGTPRGHSLFNGALDVALHVKRDDSGIIRGALTKNRNGACDRNMAFRIAIEDGGQDEDGDRITLPRCEELDASAAPPALRLTAAERAVLDVIHVAGGELTETDLRKLCIDGRSVSSSDNPDSRRRTTDRALKGLVQKCAVIFQDGLYRILEDQCDDFDDLGPDNPDSVRTNPGLSEMTRRRNPDGHGHTPLGVSGCPERCGQDLL